MTDLILWNSTSSRRRSPTDDFLDNGLAILKTYIESHGYAVEVVDWANSRQWETMTPKSLARLNGMLARWLMGKKNRNGKSRPGKKLVGALFMLSQELTSKLQTRAQRKMIRNLASHVRDTGCKVVGIKTWYGETYITARQFAGELRKIAPEVLIVAGGPHASTYREAVLEDDSFDFAVVGEGEEVPAVPVSRLFFEGAGELVDGAEVIEGVESGHAAGEVNPIAHIAGTEGRVQKQDPPKERCRSDGFLHRSQPAVHSPGSRHAGRRAAPHAGSGDVNRAFRSPLTVKKLLSV